MHLGNEAILREVGNILTQWAHLEEAMIDITASLLGDSLRKAPARQVFRAVVSSEARIAIMRALLEQAKINDKKGPFYDEVIDEFASLNKTRNSYAHGLWSTRFSDKAALLAETSTNDLAAAVTAPRRVTEKEVKAIAGRITLLIVRIYTELRKEHAQASPRKPRKPRRASAP